MPDLLNNAVFSETDNSNTSGTQPGWPEGMLAKNVNNAARALQGALKRLIDQVSGTLTSAGTGSAYTLTYAVAPEALYHGQRFLFKAHTAALANATLAVNGVGGAKALKKIKDGVSINIEANDWTAGQPAEVMYDSGLGVFFVLDSGFNTIPASALPAASETVQGAVLLATVAEVLAGTTANDVISSTQLNNLLKKGTNVAGATAISLGQGSVFSITGTGWTATSIAFADASFVGRSARLIFASAGGILTNGANLILPSGANITVGAGDSCIVMFEGGGTVYRVAQYTRADGTALVVAASGAMTYVYKAADTARNSTVTPTADPHLTFTAKAGKQYDFYAFLAVDNATTGKIKFYLNASTALGRVLIPVIIASVADAQIEGAGAGNTVDVTSMGTGLCGLNLMGTLVGGAADSVVTLYRAQSTSVAGLTTLQKESFIKYFER